MYYVYEMNKNYTFNIVVTVVQLLLTIETKVFGGNKNSFANGICQQYIAWCFVVVCLSLHLNGNAFIRHYVET